jgi:hypothetical protein
VARRRPCARHAAARCLLEKKKEDFVENPLGFEGFLGNIKNCTLLQYFVKQTRSKDYENWQGLFREVVEAPQILFPNFWVHLNANSNRANAHIRVFFFDFNSNFFFKCKINACNDDDKCFIYLTSMGCYRRAVGIAA